ncbi:MAG: hypothetical protein M1819_000694 [Sarea resinae]|nr:MAG: hypothetical protein M1819_000694 [Sarea resinae]
MFSTLRRQAAAAAATAAKREGDISTVFASLSGLKAEPLPQHFADLKARLIKGHEDQVRASWERLLKELRREIPVIHQLGPRVIPEIDFQDIDKASESFVREHRKRGVAVIRGVVPEKEAVGYKDAIRKYVKDNPQTKAFPPDDPQVFELYWSPSQLRARAHPNLLKAQRFLMSFWHSADKTALISSSHPVAYADRLRIRHPGDAQFALGAHVDGGSVERWEEEGYGQGGVYDKIWAGSWEEYDPWESSCRLPVVMDRYHGPGACSMFRMYQGWLSMSTTGPNEGTLLVNPLLSRATAYLLLRPFFSPKRDPASFSDADDFLSSSNWKLDLEPVSTLHGAIPSHGQELNELLHPHLDLSKSMAHVPEVRPGDYVAWHCDSESFEFTPFSFYATPCRTLFSSSFSSASSSSRRRFLSNSTNDPKPTAIHAVDSVHGGTADSSVMYIPACPLTVQNARYLARQREAFSSGTPPPDFPGGLGESAHLGRLSRAADVAAFSDEQGLRAFGLRAWACDGDECDIDTEKKVGKEKEEGDEKENGEKGKEGQRALLGAANQVLGFEGCRR